MLLNNKIFNLLGCLGFFISFGACAQTPANSIVPINLANTPMHDAKTVDKPTMALALSVEFPTVGAQYRDATYRSTDEYIGYYYSKGCYEYIDKPVENPSEGKSLADYKRFKFSYESSNRTCTGETFSGNYLNWASSSAIDMLRVALSGGDRYIDEDGLTILQRAVLPNGGDAPSCFWGNGTYFPTKTLVRGSVAPYFQGALPESMRAKVTSSTGSIYAANTLNGIYFGTATTSNSCSENTRNAYNLGTAPKRSAVIAQNSSRPSDGFSGICNDISSGSACTPVSDVEVWYGVGTTWRVMAIASGERFSCDSATFGSVSGAGTKKCYARGLTALTQGKLDGLNSDGFFYARVEVCTKSGSATVDHKDFDLCKAYPSGNFKPAGVIQKHADNLRISAFGYLMDQTDSKSTGRYGGVLRAPMKYVGPKTYNIYGKEESQANARLEWNPQNGVFYPNPDQTILPSGQGVANSGVINYLNKFGRTGSTPGKYKQYDPVGELYYQALRYLQGMEPTAAAVSTMFTATDKSKLDGFPAYDSWSEFDPYKDRSRAENYACLKSNIVVVGDVNTHDGNWRNIPTANKLADNEVNFRTFLSDVLNYERSYFNNPSTNYNPGTDRSQIIAYAHWAHANDIRPSTWSNQSNKQRPGLRVKTFLFDVNENSTESVVSHRQKKNQFYLASKYGGYETDPNNLDENPYSVDNRPDYGIRPPALPSSTPVHIPDLWKRNADDAATYYLQSDARNVLSAFEEIFDRAASTAQSIAQSAASTSSITATTDSYIYTGTYDTASWTGNVSAKKIVLDATTKNVTFVEDGTWDPAKKLTNKDPQSRQIVIGLGNGLGGAKTVGQPGGALSFTWSQIAGSDLETHFTKASLSAVPDDLGNKRVNYLRGVRSDEGSLFRMRSSLMGDIINAGVTYSGKPTTKFTDPSYRLFLNANQDRLPVVFAGANDGMLHAFAAQLPPNTTPTPPTYAHARGEEVFAYIPSWVAPNLPSLALKTYVDGANHQAFVDAPSAVGEAQLAFTTGDGSASDWKTVLVSGTGAGGRGVFALDVTSPESFGPSKVLWEFTHLHDEDLGYVVGRPKILKFKTGVNTYRWFAAVASGTNNYSSSFNSMGGTGQPAIFLLALDKPRTQAWDKGVNYFKISLPFDQALAATMAPGIVDFSMLWAADGAVTHIYAGDLQGNMWKLDFTDQNQPSKYKATSNWTLDKLSAFKKGDAALPFYQANRTIAGQNVRQPISAAPLLVTGPVVGGLETFYLLFGTGKYLENADITNVGKQSFYALFDNGTAESDSTSGSRVAAITAGASRLQQAVVDTTARTITVPPFTWGRPKNDGDAVTRRAGWFFDFPDTGERMIFSATDLGEFNVSFSSVIPGEAQVSQSICAADSASSNVYDINIRTGGGRYRVSQIGILGPSLFLENEEKTSADDFDSTGRARRTVVREQIMTGTKNTEVRSSSVVEIIGRLSWRQIYNYKELKNSSTPAVAP